MYYVRTHSNTTGVLVHTQIWKGLNTDRLKLGQLNMTYVKLHMTYIVKTQIRLYIVHYNLHETDSNKKNRLKTNINVRSWQKVSTLTLMNYSRSKV